MKKKNFSAIIFSMGLTILLSCSNGFGPDYDKAEIKQNIGGLLICNSVYNADIHSWTYEVKYKYKAQNDSIFAIGDGTYYGRVWNKDEQLTKFKDWIILKTGGWYGFDKVIIGKLKTNTWQEYEFSAENIEKEKLWVESKIHSLINYEPHDCFVDKIDNGEIKMHYQFRTSETNTEELEIKKITYKIDELTGQPKMTAIQ